MNSRTEKNELNSLEIEVTRKSVSSQSAVIVMFVWI